MAAAALLLSLLATAAVYWNAVSNGFIYDDFPLLVDSISVRSVSFANIRHIFTAAVNGTYRPLRVLTYAVGYRLWGMKPLGFHLVNIGLHLANMALVYSIVVGLGGGRVWGIAASAIFGLHPVQTESVGWISGVKDVQGTFFVLLSFVSYMASRGGFRRGGAPPGRAGRIICRSVSVSAFLLALLTKEGMIVLVGIIAAYELLMGRDNARHRVRRTVVSLAPYLAVSLLFVLVYFSRARTSLGGRPGDSLLLTASLMVRGFAYYFWLFLFPLRLCSDYSRFAAAGSYVTLLLSAAVLLGVMAVAVLSCRRAPWAALCILWIFLALAPVSNIIPLGSRLAERYLYLPSVGWCILAGYLVTAPLRLRSAGAAVRAACGLLFGCLLFELGVGVVMRSAVWRDQFTLRSDMIRGYPGNWAAHNWLGYYYWNMGRQKGRPSADRDIYRGLAAAEYLKGHELRLGAPQPVLGLARLAEEDGRMEKARELFRKAAVAARNDASPENVLREAGEFSLRNGSYEEAEGRFEEGIRLNPADVRLLLDLARARLRAGRAREAIEPLKAALSSQPLFYAAQAELGNAYLLMGEFDAAATAYGKYLARNPKDYRAACNLGIALEQRGDFKRALEVYDDAARRNPRRAAEIMTRRKVAELRMKLETSQKDRVLWVELGRTLERLGCYGDAASAYEKAAKLAPDSVDIACLLGGAYLASGKYEQAEEKLRFALERDPKRADAWFGLGAVAAERGDAPAAVTNLAEAVGIGGVGYRNLAAKSPLFKKIADDPKFRAFIGGAD